MTPIVPSSASNTSLVPRPTFTTRNITCLTRCCISRKSTVYAQKLILPLSTSVRLFPSIRTCVLHRNPRTQIVSAAGTEVAVDEADSPVADKESGKPNEAPLVDVGPPQVQSRRSGPVRKSEMLPVKNEELVPGATFTGKVRSVQPFGAFIDFGAFTNGLVHVSRLSDSFVKDVGTIVSVGQEVTVRIVEVNFETNRISLTMRDSDDTSKASDSSDRARTPRKGGKRREDSKKASKFVRGQNLQGTVKNLTRSGAFVSLPEGEEGFLPSSGEPLEAGQEVSVWVLHITGGKVTLTMKKEDLVASSLTQGTVHKATNPFLLAFRQNKEIASFLDEREKEEEPTISVLENNEIPQEKVNVGPSTDSNEDADPQVVTDSVEKVDGAMEIVEEKREQSSEVLAPDESVASVEEITEVVASTVEIESEGESDKTIAREVEIETHSVESEISQSQESTTEGSYSLATLV